MIAVFAYAFPHRKSRDILVELALAGKKKVCVIAAPMESLPNVDRTRYSVKSLRFAPPQDTAEVARSLGFDYVEMKHSDIDAVSHHVAEKGLKLGIVAGARILKRPVIECFDEGIVNFHPGPIPETSGLDAFFYTVKKRVSAGVTTHLIDARVDAGQQIYFDTVEIGPSDTAETVQENIYQLQLIALRRFLSDRDGERLAHREVDWSGKNTPMTSDEKWQILLDFPAWRSQQVVLQAAKRLVFACEAGRLAEVSKYLDRFPQLLEHRTPEGWTPLIVAAFNQQKDIVAELLNRGADPNATGRNGTTVLMYAKSAILKGESENLALLDLLIAKGADSSRRDKFGHAVLDYVKDSKVLTRYFTAKSGGA
ncbi:ankyrin repeat domain-containing protein [Ruegeria conchae]|uniref:formyltransferase family protein n=1 Tax=Ruegeria conchae TaxID=981384 RepID=UPI0021A39EB4|nr:formyltransferase family protein [Ruegeria conchae]UWR02862.1 ankyrin repeat domain-containing protein [Ruegeria conchae]